MKTEEVDIGVADLAVQADIHIPDEATGLVIFAHGSGSSRKSPRNNFVAGLLNRQHMATLLADLLTIPEDEVYENRFNIGLLSRRLIRITEWALDQPDLRYLPIGYFGASTGAAAALQAAAILDNSIHAVVSRGGRPDLAGPALQEVRAPVLLIVGSLDGPTIDVNEDAYGELTAAAARKIEIVAGASHLFEEPGTLQQAGGLAARWFAKYLRP
jgi:dienelactone hydrolase